MVLNQDATDAAFLKERAEANGYELIFREGRVYFGPRQLDAAPQPRIMVYAGPDTNAISFNVTDDGHKPDRATFDIAPAEGAETESETLSPDLPLLGTSPATSVEALDDGFVWRISREGNATGDAARVQAQEKANEMSFKVKGTGALDGARYGHVLKVGLPVEVDGVGTRHSGVWYADVVRPPLRPVRLPSGVRAAPQCLWREPGRQRQSAGCGDLKGMPWTKPPPASPVTRPGNTMASSAALSSMWTIPSSWGASG